MTFKYLFYSAACVLLFQGTSFGQANYQLLAPNPAMAGEAAFLNPSYLKNTHGVYLNFPPLMGFDIGLKNNIVSAGNIIDLLSETDTKEGSELNFAPLHAILDNLRKHNTIAFHSNLTLLNVGFHVGKPDKRYNINLSMRAHFHANFSVNGNFFKLFIQGNKQFAGETVDLKPELSFIGYTDIGAAVSRTLSVGDLKITPGARLRYLIGLEAVNTENSHLSFYTEEHGEYIEVSGNFNGGGGGIASPASLVNSDNDANDNLDIMQSLGKGWAFDLGVTVEYKNLSFSLASIDNGFIRFKNGGHFYTPKAGFKWEGVDINAVRNGDEVNFTKNITNLDSLGLNATQEPFKTGIGSKITFNGNYGLMEKTDHKGNKYYMSNIGISYVQGFKNIYDASTSPWISVYYQLNLGNRFTAGANFNMQQNIFDFGANVGMSLAKINLAVGTNSLAAAFSRNISKQVDVFFLLGLDF